MGSSRSTRYRGLILCIEASAGRPNGLKIRPTERGKEKLQRAGHHNLYLMGRGMWNPIEMRETSSESALRLAGPSNPMSSFKRERKKKKKKNKRAFSRRREFKRAGAWVTGKRQERASKSFSELLPSAHPVWCCHKQNRYCIWHGLHHLVIASDSRQKRVHQHGPKSEVDLFFFFFKKFSSMNCMAMTWPRCAFDHGQKKKNWNFKPILLSRPA